MPVSDLWIGAWEGMEDQSIDIDSNPHTLTIAGDAVYADHATASLSLIGLLLGAMTAEGLSNPYVQISADLKIRIGADGVFTLDWTDTDARDMLGFNVNLSGASSYTADAISKYLWGPFRRSSPSEPFGVQGNPHYDGAVVFAPGGESKAAFESTTTDTISFAYHHIPRAYWQTNADGTGSGGEFAAFWTNVLRLQRKALLLTQSDAPTLDASSTAALSYTIGNAWGPYKLDMSGRDALRLPSQRSIAKSDEKWDYTLKAIKAAEYS